MKNSHFPLFVDISDKAVLVVGGGRVALRRINTLLKFECKVMVVAPEAATEIAELARKGELLYECREFEESDLGGVFLAVAATDKRDINHLIGQLAKEKGIYASVADCKEECSFFFPAVIEDGDIIIGVTAQGRSHHAAREAADKIRGALGHLDK